MPTTDTAVSPQRQIEAPKSAVVPLRILVVDDNIDAAQSLKLVLTLSGHSVTSVHSGFEVVDEVRIHRPDVILLDIALPGLNGYQVAERLRAAPETKDIVLIATTGYGQDEDRRRALQSGFDHHLVKPIVPEMMSELLTSVAERRHRSA